MSALLSAGSLSLIEFALGMAIVGVFGAILGGFTLTYLWAHARVMPGELTQTERGLGIILAMLNFAPLAIAAMVALGGIARELL